MPRDRHYQSNLTGGELSPRLFGWIDVERYGNGLARCENLIVMPHGGARRRPGTVFVHEPDAAGFGYVRLIGFEFATAQSYVLGLLNQKLRFYSNHGIVIDARGFTNGDFTSDITGWTDTSTGSGAIAHDAGNGRLNLVGAAASVAAAEQELTTVSIEQYTVTVDVFTGDVGYKVGTTSGASDLGSGTLTVGTDRTFNFTRATSGSVFVTFENANNDTRAIDNVRLSQPDYIIDSPYEENDLDDVRGVQESSTMRLVHPDWAPRKLTRGNAANSWSLEVLDFRDGPYLDFDIDSQPTTTLTPSAASGSGVTLTASNTDDINDGQGFLATDVGRLVRLDNATLPAVNWGWAIIVGYTSSTVVTIDIQRAFTAATATTRWRLGAWSETTGYPRQISFFDERVVYANSVDDADVFWMSRPRSLDDFAPSEADGTVNKTHAITYRVLSDKQNAIDWLAAADTLVVGTRNGEFIINSSSRTEAVSPENIIVKRQTNWGSNRFIIPALIGGQVLFVQRAGRRLREFVFDFDVNRYVAVDATIAAEHITASGIFDMVYQQEPDSVLWCSRSDGLLIGLTYEREQSTLAWHRHQIGGVFGTGGAVVESLATIPTPDESANELWMTVVRTINGQSKRYVEYMKQPFNTDNGDVQADMWFVDSGLQYDGAPATVFAGLDHVEGEELQILADGAVRAPKIVVGGQITLDRPASKVTVGLAAPGYLEPLVPPSPWGLGWLIRPDHINILFHETLGCRFGRLVDDTANWDEIPFRQAPAQGGQAPALFTGTKRVGFGGSKKRDRQIGIAFTDPTAVTVLAIGTDSDQAQR